MKRQRMVGDYELVHEADIDMYRIRNMETEEFSAWFSSREADELQGMNDHQFFVTAEKSIQDARDSGHEQTGDTKTPM